MKIIVIVIVIVCLFKPQKNSKTNKRLSGRHGLLLGGLVLRAEAAELVGGDLAKPPPVEENMNSLIHSLVHSFIHSFSFAAPLAQGGSETGAQCAD